MTGAGRFARSVPLADSLKDAGGALQFDKRVAR